MKKVNKIESQKAKNTGLEVSRDYTKEKESRKWKRKYMRRQKWKLFR